MGDSNKSRLPAWLRWIIRGVVTVAAWILKHIIFRNSNNMGG